jgi:5-methyltetrahydropteroyltriglutamate--homocysteine methyltransferase
MAVKGAYLTGSFPRSPELVEATRSFDRGKILDQELRAVEEDDTREAVACQVGNGFAFVSNPQLNWQDIFRPLLPALAGVEIGALTRWFDNNTFYRQPVVTDSVELKGTIDGRYLAREHLPENRPWKITLPGPWTFTCLSADHFYGDSGDLLLDVAEAVGGTARELVSLGFDHIQFSEPALVVNPPAGEMWDLAVEALRRASGGVGATTSLHTFFGDGSPILEHGEELPTDIIGIDLYATDLEALRGMETDKAIALGCVDARNSLVESRSSLVQLARRALEILNPREAYITPNCDLEFLTRRIAEKKMKTLGDASREMMEVA